jgi:hypothetical protein
MAERYQLPRSCVPPMTRRKDCGCSPSGGSKGGKTRCIGEHEDMVAFQGGHPPFKGDPPHLRPQPSRAESSPTSSKAQAHTSCNRRAGCYVRATAPPHAPLPRLLNYGTSTATRGNPAYGPTVPARRIGHGPVSHGRRCDGRCGQKWAGSNGGGRRAKAAVTSSAKLTSPHGTAREPSPTA